MHKNYAAFCDAFTGSRIFGFSTHATKTSFDVQYQHQDVLLFGPETRGLPDSVKTELLPDRLLKIPMREPSRSLNLSNAVSIAVYEFWRQLEFSV